MKPTLLSIITGFFIAISGESIRIWAVSFAGSETRTTSGVGGTYLVTQGPYSIIRNPLYAGNILIYTGIGIMSLALFPYLQIFGLLFFTFQYYCIILTEEEFLEKKFGDTFIAYKRTVKRFMPFLNFIPKNIQSDLTFNLKQGFTSEKRSLQAFVLSAGIIIIYYLIRQFVISES